MQKMPWNLTPRFRIKPLFSLKHRDFSHYLLAVQDMILRMIPESTLLDISSLHSTEEICSAFYKFNRKLPLLLHSTFSNGIAIQILYQAEFTAGVGRYLTDMFSRWLVPGKKLEVVGHLGLNFQFELYPDKSFTFRQELFEFTEKNDLSIALKNLPKIFEEMRINILAVYLTRYLLSMKTISSQEKEELVQQNLLALFQQPYAENAYDEMQRFQHMFSHEEKLGQVKKHLDHLLGHHPQRFDQDVFYEMAHLTSHFQSQYPFKRDPRHISRVVAFHYLFKKTLLQKVEEAPQERHLRVKILKLIMDKDLMLAVLIGMNLLRETERFGQRHILSAIQQCVPQAIFVEHSFLMDRKDEKVRIYYLELQKGGPVPFSSNEIRMIKHQLPNLLKKRIENIVPPIFMPRNEEEVLRTIVVLAKQIKFLRDLPHLTIHYEKQTESEITFLIILVRPLLEHSPPIKEILKSSSLKIFIDEIRSAGTLKRSYPKEATVFRIVIDKSPFFRKDYSLDLKRARQQIASELKTMLGECRDFNGGMIHKQNEALEQLRRLIGSPAQHHEVLLENFYHSLRPGIMQTVHSPKTLGTLFELLLAILDEDLAQKGFSLKAIAEEKFFFLMIGAAAPTFKEDVQSSIVRLKIPSYDLTTSFLQIQEFATLGFILRMDDSEKRLQFQQAILDAMLKWKINFSCPVEVKHWG